MTAKLYHLSPLGFQERRKTLAEDAGVLQNYTGPYDKTTEAATLVIPALGNTDHCDLSTWCFRTVSGLEAPSTTYLLIGPCSDYSFSKVGAITRHLTARKAVESVCNACVSTGSFHVVDNGCAHIAHRSSKCRSQLCLCPPSSSASSLMFFLIHASPASASIGSSHVPHMNVLMQAMLIRMRKFTGAAVGFAAEGEC